MNESKKGVIYILTNPSFPEYVKIGYADDVEKDYHSLIEVSVYHLLLEFMGFMKWIQDYPIKKYMLL